MKQQTTHVVPMLSVRHGTRAIEFYRKAFGATEQFQIANEQGEVVAQLSVRGADFWLADESPQHSNFSPDTLGGGTVRMLMIVDDPDEVFDQAVAAGATVVSSMANQHGWRVGRVVDPFGHHWEIGKHLL